MSGSGRIRIALDCRSLDARQGIGTAVLALANALSESESDEQEYTFIVPEQLREWLSPYIFGPCRLTGISASRLSRWKKSLGAIAPLHSVWMSMRSKMLPVAVSSGDVQCQGFVQGHLPSQAASLTPV